MIWPWIPSVRPFLCTLEIFKDTVNRDPEYGMTVNIENIKNTGPAFSIQHLDVSLHTPMTLSAVDESFPVMPSDAYVTSDMSSSSTDVSSTSPDSKPAISPFSDISLPATLSFVGPGNEDDDVLPYHKCLMLSVKQKKTKEPNYFILTSKEAIDRTFKQKHDNEEREWEKVQRKLKRQQGNKLQRPLNLSQEMC